MRGFNFHKVDFGFRHELKIVLSIVKLVQIVVINTYVCQVVFLFSIVLNYVRMTLELKSQSTSYLLCIAYEYSFVYSSKQFLTITCLRFMR